MSNLTQEELLDRCPYCDLEYAQLWIEGYEAALDDMEKKKLEACMARSKSMREFLNLDIVQWCLDNEYNNTADGGVALADAFRKLHDKYKVKYKEIHEIFWKQYYAKADEMGLYITRTGDIFVKGWERKATPIYKGQWVSHLYKR